MSCFHQIIKVFYFILKKLDGLYIALPAARITINYQGVNIVLNTRKPEGLEKMLLHPNMEVEVDESYYSSCRSDEYKLLQAQPV